MKYLFLTLSFAANASSPVASPTCPDVFVLTRTENRNELHYQARMDNGKLDLDRPLMGRWRMLEKGPDSWEDWTWLERVMVFGAELGNRQGTKIPFEIKAASGLKLELDIAGACPRAAYIGEGGPFVLTHVFIETDERNKVPDQMQILLTGIDGAGKTVQKNISIKK